MNQRALKWLIVLWVFGVFFPVASFGADARRLADLNPGSVGSYPSNFTVYSGQTIVATNDSWSSTPDVAALEKATRAVNASPLASNSEDAALLLDWLPAASLARVLGSASLFAISWMSACTNQSGNTHTTAVQL